MTREKGPLIKNIDNLGILVVEDDDFQRSMHVLLLKNMGLQRIYEAIDGNCALEIIKKQSSQVDIIICDLLMPRMDGMELIRHIGDAKSKIAVIIASGLTRRLINSVEIMARDYGVNMLGLIEKPVTIEKLTPLLEKFISIQTTLKLVKKQPSGLAFTHQEILDGLKRNEFEPFFQPKVDMHTRKLIGFEALARWRHPKKGIITPKAFIEQMETGGLIDELTWFMLENSVRYCRKWCTEGLDITVSINLSINSLLEPDLAKRIIALVSNYNVDPCHIILEVTESTIATHSGSILENLSRLCLHGFGLSIDDFGTGYSSLQQLMRIPYNELKIDQSFITNAVLQELTRVIVASSLDMAKKLTITSVAEGIESQEDWNHLSMLGCDLAQGYFISKPMPGNQVFDWAVNWARKI